MVAIRRRWSRRPTARCTRPRRAAVTAWWPLPPQYPSPPPKPPSDPQDGTLVADSLTGEVSPIGVSMDSTAYLVLSWIALAFMGLMLFLALFEPSLPYRMSKRPPLPLDS